MPCRRDIPAGRARRQNNKTKDAGGGRWQSEERKRRRMLRSGRSERRKKEQRGNERRRDRSVRPGRMGKESCIADAVDVAAHERQGGTRDAGGQPEKEETGQECTDECVVLRATRPRRLSRERVSELSLESPLRLARPAVRIRGRRYPCPIHRRLEQNYLYIIHP